MELARGHHTIVMRLTAIMKCVCNVCEGVCVCVLYLLIFFYCLTIVIEKFDVTFIYIYHKISVVYSVFVFLSFD